MSIHTAPSSRMGHRSMAFSSFRPPRLTYRRPPRTSTAASSATGAPGLSTRCPSTNTWPLMMVAWALCRLSCSPRCTSSTSNLTFLPMTHYLTHRLDHRLGVKSLLPPQLGDRPLDGKVVP